MLGLEKLVIPSAYNIINASGERMDISGSVELNLSVARVRLKQNFKVLNTETCTNVILGRDFMSKFHSMEFDLASHKVKLGKVWLNCVRSKNDERVRIDNKITIQGRAESVVSVRCNKAISLLTMDFEPTPVQGLSGVYATRYRVIPNLRGVFQITMLNTTNSPVVIHQRKCIGKLHPVGQAQETYPRNTVPKAAVCFLEENISSGENLSALKKQHLKALINAYKGTFASNPKKPSLVKA